MKQIYHKLKIEAVSPSIVDGSNKNKNIHTK